MSAAQVTEAHRELARRIMFEFTQAGTATASDVRMAAQIIADSEAQATAELRGALALGQQNCDDVFEDLRNERDQLRAECNNLRADLDAIKAIRDEETARAERAEAELAEQQWLKESALKRAKELTAELAKAKAILASIEEDGTEEHNAAVRLRQELAAERARLDWLLSRMGGNVLPANKCVAWTVDVYHYGNRFPSRAVIDAAMKGENK